MTNIEAGISAVLTQGYVGPTIDTRLAPSVVEAGGNLLPPGFNIGERFGLDRLPLANNMPVVRNLEGLGLEYLVSQHETNHLLIADGLGFSAIGISSRPFGDSLGWTLFNGDMDLNSFFTTAVGGALPTTDGDAFGFGSDLGKVADIAQYYLGKNPHAIIEAHKDKGQSVLDSIPDSVREKIAEMVTLFGTVSGANKIQEILDRAYFEYEWEKAGLNIEDYLDSVNLDHMRHFKVIPKEVDPRDIIPQQGEYTIIGGNRNTVFKGHYINGNLIDVIGSEKRCPICGGVNGHDVRCSVNNQETVDTVDPVNIQNKYDFSKPVPQEGNQDRFPKFGTIFSSQN